MAATSVQDDILHILETDAKASYGEIADKVGVSKPTVRKYINKLETEGIITGYAAEIDPKKLAGQTIAIVGIEVKSECYVEAADALKSLDTIRSLYTSSGDHMLMAEVRGQDGDEVGRIIREEIIPIDGVIEAHPSFLQERLK